ncbi:MAG TPA: P-II family nitrogen regulator [Rudaea sp.]|jgi:nitrogen regulatory protein P-II 1|nr:P-II family nitrogen regulator [Rudaea sp.]
MKEVKAFVHRARIADIVQALEAAGFRHLAVVDVKSLLTALSDSEQNYSIELGERVINQAKIEVFCEDHQTEHAVQIIRQFGRTGQALAGWVYESTVDRVWPIDRSTPG